MSAFTCFEILGVSSLVSASVLNVVLSTIDSSILRSLMKVYQVEKYSRYGWQREAVCVFSKAARIYQAAWEVIACDMEGISAFVLVDLKCM